MNPFYQPFVDESNSFSCNMTFGADEILKELNIVLNKNITHPNLRQNIIKDVAHQLNSSARYMKIMHFNEKIKIISRMFADKSQNRRSPEELAQRVKMFKDELLNFVSFIQMYGGLDEQGAQELKIVPNFIEALHYLHDVERNIKWVKMCPEIKAVYREFVDICTKTFANILNSNIMKFESHNSLIMCLNWLIEIDFKGFAAQLLIPPVKTYFEQLELQKFLEEPSFPLLNSAITQSIRKGIDISDEIDQLKFNPEDPNKFFFLLNKMSTVPTLKKNVIKAALETSNYAAISVAFKTFPDNKEIEKHFYNRLAMIMNKWLNSLIVSRDPINNREVREYHLVFKNMYDVIGAEGRKKVLSVAAESETGKALLAFVKCHASEMSHENSMTMDISTIVSMVKSV